MYLLDKTEPEAQIVLIGNQRHDLFQANLQGKDMNIYFNFATVLS